MEGDVASQQFNQSRAGFARLATSSDAPDLTTAGSRAVEAWFLGPKAENADELERLVVEAVRDQAFSECSDAGPGHLQCPVVLSRADCWDLRDRRLETRGGGSRQFPLATR
jgi:hypothetical protein